MKVKDYLIYQEIADCVAVLLFVGLCTAFILAIAIITI